MRKTHHGVFLILMVSILLILSLGWAAAANGQFRNLVSSGGGSLTNSEITLQNTLGQPIAGTVKNGMTLCSGFFCAPKMSENIIRFDFYIPIVISSP